ncbi:unnamed protein product [Lepeophtheirus salmonis]|uniref:(salmon louse) hypothetical protein n=1 Tax=Lepeophtheirus salmonis TaxID=72036 RepID=A0A7R8CF56_LEPSM|nr:unnamed protein product [Lepeophtheirus salmonis]CAF2763239.1 unnamed protein product [Lepeophtheirus salmonis]
MFVILVMGLELKSELSQLAQDLFNKCKFNAPNVVEGELCWACENPVAKYFPTSLGEKPGHSLTVRIHPADDYVLSSCPGEEKTIPFSLSDFVTITRHHHPAYDHQPSGRPAEKPGYSPTVRIHPLDDYELSARPRIEKDHPILVREKDVEET